MGTFKENIQHEMCLFKPTSLEKDLMLARKVKSKNMLMATKRTTSNTYRDNNVLSYNPLQLARLKPQQMDEGRKKFTCFNCDNKYSKGHKCGEKKLFYVYCEEEEAKETEPYQNE